MMSEEAAYKDWERVNGVKVIDEDMLLKWDDSEREMIFKEKAWKKEFV